VEVLVLVLLARVVLQPRLMEMEMATVIMALMLPRVDSQSPSNHVPLHQRVVGQRLQPMPLGWPSPARLQACTVLVLYHMIMSHHAMNAIALLVPLLSSRHLVRIHFRAHLLCLRHVFSCNLAPPLLGRLQVLTSPLLV